MSASETRITKRLVDSIEPSDRDRIIWDSELPGFGFRVRPTGHKTYVVQYRIPGLGRRGFAKRVSLGEHGKLTPEEARKLAKVQLGNVALGDDPATARDRKKGIPTVRELGKTYLSDTASRLKERTAAEYKRLWTHHVLPAIGNKQVTDVSASDVRRLHRSMKDVPYGANRTLALLSAFFSFAAAEGVELASGNPTSHVERFPEEPRERFLAAEEFKVLGSVLATAEQKGLPPAPGKRYKFRNQDTKKHRPKIADVPIVADPFAVAAIRFLALTGCRKSEALTLRWEAVDFERGYLRLGETKTGRSVRPLSKTVAQLLASLPRLEKNPFVFPGKLAGQHLKEIDRLWHAVRYAAKLDELRLHDLRHSYASFSAVDGESLLVIRSLLGHKNIATTERYAHLGDDPVKAAAERASLGISRLLVRTPQRPKRLFSRSFVRRREGAQRGDEVLKPADKP